MEWINVLCLSSLREQLYVPMCHVWNIHGIINYSRLGPELGFLEGSSIIFYTGMKKYSHLEIKNQFHFGMFQYSPFRTNNNGLD